MTAPVRRAPALLTAIGEHFAKLSQRLHLETARNDADATKYAAGALADAGFSVTEQPFTRRAHRRFSRWTVTGVLALCSAAAFAIAHYAGLDLEFSSLAAVGSTYLLEQWFQHTRVAVQSANVIATRGKPRAWLVAYLDTVDDSDASVPGVGEALLVGFILLAMLLLDNPKPIFRLFAYVMVALLLLRGIARRMFRARSPSANAPATGAAAVLAAVEMLGPNYELGVLLTRGHDLERSGINSGLESRTKAPVVLVASVGGTGRLEMIGTGESPLAVAVDIERAAAADNLPLAIVEAKRVKSFMGPAFERFDRVSVTLSRARDPDIFRHLRVLVSSRRQPDAVLDPLGQIAVVSRLLVRTLDAKSEAER